LVRFTQPDVKTLTNVQLMSINAAPIPTVKTLMDRTLVTAMLGMNTVTQAITHVVILTNVLQAEILKSSHTLF